MASGRKTKKNADGEAAESRGKRREGNAAGEPPHPAGGRLTAGAMDERLGGDEEAAGEPPRTLRADSRGKRRNKETKQEIKATWQT